MTKHFYTTVAALAVMASAATSASAVNLLTNGGFETGDFSGFTSNDQTGDDHPAVVIRTDGTGRAYPLGAFLEGIPSDPITTGGSTETGGTYAAYFSSDSTVGGAAPVESLTQNVALTGGMNYTFGFDYYLPSNGQVNPGNATFSLSIGGVTFATLSAASLPSQTWLQFSGAYTALATGSTAVTLTYSAPGSATNGKDFVIDRVFLATTSSLVPEPASWAMMVAGFGLMGAALRRKRTNVSFA